MEKFLSSQLVIKQNSGSKGFKLEFTKIMIITKCVALKTTGFHFDENQFILSDQSFPKRIRAFYRKQ